MTINDVKMQMHSADFSTTGVVTGFLHEITGLQLDTGDSQEAKILTDHLMREYNRKCYYSADQFMTGQMVAPYDVGFRPTIDAAGSASVY